MLLFLKEVLRNPTPMHCNFNCSSSVAVNTDQIRGKCNETWFLENKWLQYSNAISALWFHLLEFLNTFITCIKCRLSHEVISLTYGSILKIYFGDLPIMMIMILPCANLTNALQVYCYCLLKKSLNDPDDFFLSEIWSLKPTSTHTDGLEDN